MDINVFDELETINDLLPENAREATPEETANWLLDDGPVLKTTWTVYDRIFPDGQRELCATRTTRIRQTGPLPYTGNTPRGESENRDENDEDSVKRAKQNVRLRCKAIAADRMITLTYRENMEDMARLKKDWDAFRRRMGKHKEFHYVATIEKQERGAFHIHVAVAGRQVYNLIRSIWQRIVGTTADGKTGGQINVRDPHRFGFGKHGAHKLASYIAKYISPEPGTHEFNAKRYWSSRGIVVPEKNFYQLPYGTTTTEAFTYVMELAANYNNAGMTFFGNQALGVCWIATEPTCQEKGNCG